MCEWRPEQNSTSWVKSMQLDLDLCHMLCALPICRRGKMHLHLRMPREQPAMCSAQSESLPGLLTKVPGVGQVPDGMTNMPWGGFGGLTSLQMHTASVDSGSAQHARRRITVSTGSRCLLQQLQSSKGLSVNTKLEGNCS